MMYNVLFVSKLQVYVYVILRDMWQRTCWNVTLCDKGREEVQNIVKKCDIIYGQPLRG